MLKPERFMLPRKRKIPRGARKARARGRAGNAAVRGLRERHGEVRRQVVSNIRRGTLEPEVNKHAEAGATVDIDELASCNGLESECAHMVINHAEAYVRGEVNTNCMENFWSLLKRGIKGTYVSVEPFHLFRYLDEEAFRFNTRKDNDAGRFLRVMQMVEGKRLEYGNLIGGPS